MRYWSSVVLVPAVLFSFPLVAQAQDYSFTDVTSTAGVSAAVASRHWSGSWNDFNGDGLLDLYVANGTINDGPGPDGANMLFRNNGDGTFTNVTTATGTGDPYAAMRNIWADYDNDGDQDLYSHNFIQSTLYQNNGNLFTNVNGSSGAGVSLAHGTGSAWGDYDRDGWLDLLLTAFPGRYVLLRNNQDGTFINVQVAAGIPLDAAAMGVAWGDYDNDGDLDFASAAVTPEAQAVLFRNNGNGTFTDVTSVSGIILESGSSLAPVTWGDYDNDGWLDLVASEVTLGSAKSTSNRIYLFRNLKNGTFTDVTGAAGLAPPMSAVDFWDAGWADYDNDGDLDLYFSVTGPNLLYRNNGDGTFTDVAPSLGLAFPEYTKGSVWGDYDNDGDIDLYIYRFADTNILVRNAGGPNHWFQVRLSGTESNRDGIGARITATTGSKFQIREVNGGTGFFAQHTPVQQFGLGTAESVDKLQVEWPSGKTDVICHVPPDFRIVVLEGIAPDPGCPGDGSPPAWPGATPLAATPAGASRVGLSWTSAGDPFGVVGYGIFRGGQQVGFSPGLSYVDAGLLLSTQYCYKVRALDAEGEWSVDSNQSCATTAVDSLPPDPPPGLTASVAGLSEIDLSWGIPNDDGTIVGYNVFREGLLIASSPAPFYNDSAVIMNMTYCYRVTALDAAGHESGQSNQACATPQDTMQPEPPAGLSTTGVAANSVNLSWQAATDDVGVTGYRVYRGALLAGSPGGTTFSDTGLQAQTNYTYTVTAVDAADNESFPSNAVPVTTVAAGAPGTGQGSDPGNPADSDPATSDPVVTEPEGSDPGENNPGATDTADSGTGADPAADTQDSGSQDASETSGSGGDPRCFIATAAYGSPLEPRVMLLRQVRDRYLKAFSWGRTFVRTYYAQSPPWADWISRHAVVRAAARWVLWPLVVFAWVMLKAGLAVKGFILAGLSSVFMIQRCSRCVPGPVASDR